MSPACPCGSSRDLAHCCGLYLGGAQNPPTAEALMRSRYSAYTLGDIDYLARTLAPESLHDFDRASAQAWAAQAEWRGLEIQSTQAGGPADDKGVVVFVATYRQAGETIAHREVSQFRRDDDGAWKFVRGDVSVSRATPKVGRNDPCSCGSGKKFKKCCGAAASA